MNSYYYHALLQKKKDFINIAVPSLIKLGLGRFLLENLFDGGQVRIRWGVDWNNFTVHDTNPKNEPVWKIDEDIHSLWKGIYVGNKDVMTCFITEKDYGNLSSVAIIDLYTLAGSMKQYGAVHKSKNRYNAQTFITLPFCHKSLQSKIWGVGIRR